MAIMATRFIAQAVILMIIHSFTLILTIKHITF